MELQRPARKAGAIFNRLDADWAELCADSSVRAALSGWLTADHLATGVAAAAGAWVEELGPEQLLAALRPGGASRSDALTDAVLRALLQRACGRDQAALLAARFVVQAMVPAAVRMARSQVRAFAGRTFEAVGHLVVAAMYETARSGRIHTRPGRPAANILLDTLGRVCRELAADREELGEDLVLAEDLADPAPGPAEAVHARAVRTAASAAGLHLGTDDEPETSLARLEVLELLLDAMDADTPSPTDARAIAWYYTAVPLPDTQAAAAVGSTPDAWRRRRSRAVRALKTSLRPTAA